MKYPIGIQQFNKLRNDGYVYVDKTALIYQLAHTGCYYFLSRPRRFGKSLLLSTMEAYFTGKKELFQGLAIEQLETEWKSYPILHLDLNTGRYETKGALERRLDETLTAWEELYGASSPTSPEIRFERIVRRAYEQTGRQVVILIDEYDKPMLSAIGNEALQDDYRSTLKAFYSVLKTQDKYIKFAFLTGVTKFSKVSVFSDLNNLKDISMDRRYTDICGITEKELHQYFDESIKELASANGLTFDETCDKLKEWYDGYHFEYNTAGVYNPFSLLNTLDSLTFKGYWFETGTPTFLVELLKQSDYDLNNLQQEQVTSDMLNSIDSLPLDPIPFIYQSGYLTITGYDEEFDMYSLDFPNQEVEKGFTSFLLPAFTTVKKSKATFFVKNFVTAVENGRPEEFLQLLQTMFEDNDYRIAGKMEIYFQNAMCVIFKMMGFYTEVEHATSKGRVDVVIKTKDYIYIIECKLDHSADEALQQIEEKDYARPFALDKRKLYKIGISFSSKERGIEEYKIKEE